MKRSQLFPESTTAKDGSRPAGEPVAKQNSADSVVSKSSDVSNISQPDSTGITPNGAHPESGSRNNNAGNNVSGRTAGTPAAEGTTKIASTSGSIDPLTSEGEGEGFALEKNAANMVNFTAGVGSMSSCTDVERLPGSAEPVVSVGGDDTGSSVLKRMEETFASTLDAQDQIDRLAQLIGALENAPQEFPQATPVVDAMSETGLPGDDQLVGDTIAHAALIGAMVKGEKEEGVSMETCQQPSNSAGVGEQEVIVAGEIFSGMKLASLSRTGMPPAGTVAGSDRIGISEDPTLNHTPQGISAAPQSPVASSINPAQAQKSQPKRPRFQLAASFTQSSHHSN